jgi:hypothetical protein
MFQGLQEVPMNTTDGFTYADEQFFRIVDSLFSPSFVFGASVLLGSYDEDEPPYVPVEQAQVGVTAAVRV